MANSSTGGGRAEAERWLEIAGRLLAARDLVGSKRFAERAMEADPMLDGVDSVLSVADVLLASQRRIGAHHVDWYAVLGVDPSADESTIRQEHRRLAGLLRLNTHAGADSASHLVADALSFLTDPSKKKLLDQELKKQSLKPAPSPNSSNKPKKDKEKEREKSKEKEKSTPPVKAKKAYVANAFWTACPFCCHLHQYAKSYKNKSLLCPNSACRRPFHASELPVPPPVVPGTDTYYSAWGFFPMGYPKQKDLDENWKPFHPVFPWNPDKTNKAITNGTANTESPAGGSSFGTDKGKKTMARKKVGRPPKRHMSGETGQVAVPPTGQVAAAENVININEARGININEEAGNFGGGDEDMGGFEIGLDTTDELLGNLQNLPFLRDDVVPSRII